MHSARPRHATRRRLAVMLLTVGFVVASLGVPQRVRAVGAGAPVAESEVGTLGALWLREATEKMMDSLMRDSFAFNLQLAIINMLNTFAQNFAYETAVWIASGGKAQSPLFDPRTTDDFIRDTALGAGLQFIDDLDKFGGGQLGFEGGFGIAQFICAPSIEFKLILKLALQDRLKPKPPLCTWKQLSENWGSFTSREGLTQTLSKIGAGFEPGESDLSAALELHGGITDRLTAETFQKLNEFIANKGYRPLQDKIAGLTRTPSDIVRETLVTSYIGTIKDDANLTAEQTANAVGSFEHFLPMLGAAGQALAVNFGITLAAQALQQQVFTRGIFTLDQLLPTNAGSSSSAGPRANVRQEARVVYADLRSPRVTSSGNYDMLAEFASCDPARRQPTTCVMDAQFQDAVRRALANQPMTVREAMDAGLLHGDWPLIPERDAARDQDPLCVQSAYCASNLAKLRRARILPVGWEFAANHPQNNPERPVTLGQVVDAFAQNGLDGICGTAGSAADGAGTQAESPFCGLMDPNWILELPVTQCRVRGPGETLLELTASIRADACTDTPTCLETDANGRCVDRYGDAGYGYCLREKNVWKIRGRTCPPQASSCRAYTDRAGTDLAVLTATVNRAECNAGNAGCRWYAASRDAAGAWRANDRRYFNRNVEQCEPANEGCAELIPAPAVARNLIVNPSFERDEDGDRVPDGWRLDLNPPESAYAVVYRTDGTEAFDGRAAVLPNYRAGKEPYSVIQDSIPIIGGAPYVISAYAKGLVSTNGARILLKFTDAAGAPVPTRGVTTSPLVPSSACVVPDEHGGHVNSVDVLLSTDAAYARGGCALTAPSGAAYVQVSLHYPYWVDAVQLEAGGVATAFTDAYHVGAPRTYLKVPPPEYRCDDEVLTNRNPACAQFAQFCRREDIGCERFTPRDGSPTIAGQYADADRCPTACVGYAAFREDASSFDARDAFDFFIPSTARQCSAAEAGCAEFTNLDALARGGEARESFTFLRQCRKPTDDGVIDATYYTWEGSESEGYQLRSHRLRATSAAASASPEVTTDPHLPADHDCARWYAKSPLLPSGAANPDYDPSLTPDCRAFYAQDGTIHHRLLSRTILITDDCTPYRLSHALSETVCVDKDGTFENGACIFRGYRPESVQCSAAVNGCRVYRGNAGGALQTLLATTFDQPDATGSYVQGWVGADTTGESLVVTGKSMTLAAGDPKSRTLRDANEALTEAQCTERGGEFHAAVDTTPAWCSFRTYLRPGGTYELLLVAKGIGTITAALMDGSATLGTFREERTPVGLAWQRVVLGPLVLPPDATPSDAAALTLTATGGTVHVDEVILRAAPATVAVVKGSWVTPVACDRASMDENAAPQAQGMLNCRAYTDRAGSTVTLRSFARLCSAEVVGCTAFYDTQGNAERTAPMPPPISELDNVTVPADRIRFLVDDPAKSCPATAKSCKRFALPTLDRRTNAAGVPTGEWSETFLKDDPERYVGSGATLCRNEALFCEEYAGRDGALAFFKDPGNRTCEFQERIEIGTAGSGVFATGWFRKGTNEPCDASYVIRSAEYGIRSNADAAYAGWTGTCRPEFDRCTELRDPTDVSAAYPTGRPYHVIKDEALDLTSCAGQVSRKEGCALLADASITSTSWSTAATYARVDANRGQLQPPVDCGRTPGECKRCGVPRKCRAADGVPQTTPAPPTTCTMDAQCDTQNGFTCRGGELTARTCTTNAQCNAAGGEECIAVQNDANLIVKVQRDRACSQWLTRDGCIQSFDEQTTGWKQVCTRLRYETSDRAAPDAVATAARLTRQAYQRRDTRWSGSEVSGYAVPGLPPLHQLEQVRESPSEEPYLAYVQCPANAAALGCGTITGSCTGGTGSACGPRLAEFGNQPGRCVGGRCAYRIEGASRRCRVYPEQTSPFPPTLRDTTGDAAQQHPQFPNANVCEGDADCSCDYQKVTFESGTSKYLASRAVTPLGICVGGDHDGKSCTPGATGIRGEGVARASCNAVDASDENAGSRNGTCSGVKERLEVRGVEGYCVEEDRSIAINGEPDRYACRTFLPIDHVSGSVDVTNVVKGAAAIELALERNQIEWYCAEGIGGAQNTEEVHLRLVRDTSRTDGIAGKRYTHDVSLIGVEAEGTTTGNLQPFLAPKEHSAPPEPFRPKLQPVNEDGVPTSTMPSVVRFSHLDEEKDCQDGPRAGWCIWPATSHDEIQRCDGDDIACRYSNGGTQEGDSWAVNFFGCYELANQAPSLLYYPWDEAVMGPVYNWQLEGFAVGRLSTGGFSDESDARFCQRNTGEFDSADDDGKDILGEATRVELRPDPNYAGDRVWWGQIINSAPSSHGRGGVAFHAIFGADGRLLGMAIEAYSAGQEKDAQFFINALTLRYKQGCQKVAKVVQAIPGQPKVLYPKANALWEKNTAFTISGIPYSVRSECRPWGGIQPFRFFNRTTSASVPVSGPWTPNPNNPYVTRSDGAVCAADTGATFTGSALRQLFARAFDLLDIGEVTEGTYNAGGGLTLFSVPRWALARAPTYRAPSGGVAAATWDDRPLGTPPVVMGVGSCDGSQQKCQEDDRLKDTITVNGQNSGDVVGRGGTLPVRIRFFYYADPNQMPVKEVGVSWGNGATPYLATEGPYGNRRGYTGEESRCDNSNFGQSTDACRPRPVTITYVYECPYTATNHTGLPTCGADNNKRPTSAQMSTGCWDPTANACIFVPRVHVKDNWGMCTGVCSNASTYSGRGDGDKCFDGTGMASPDDKNECETNNPAKNPWVNFQGRIVVSPP